MQKLNHQQDFASLRNAENENAIASDSHDESKFSHP
jgi:hypothetical protein